MMHDSVINRDDSVLLVGEGNFSFSVELAKLKLELKITSCYFEKQSVYPLTEENITILENKGVRVLRYIDATKLNEYEELKSHVFHHIIFNFPHVGGKSKIQLNRELLRKFFVSCAPLLDRNGTVIVSLCQGQGGSSREMVSRHYADSWKVVEMAAHGGFVLAAVEPWIKDSPLGSYCCVGRRSHGASFHQEGAMVHIFRFAPISFKFHHINHYLDLLEPHQIKLHQCFVTCSSIEKTLLEKKLISINGSKLYDLVLSLVNYCSREKIEAKIFEVSLEMDNSLLHITKVKYVLNLLKQEKSIDDSQVHLHWLVAFRDLDCDFTTSPVSCCIIVKGPMSFTICRKWLADLGCSNGDFLNVVFERDPCMCLLQLDKFAMNLFDLSNWHELWASGAHITINEKGKLSWNPACVSPPDFTFDLSLKSFQPIDINAVCYVLWQLAGVFVKNVEVVDSYESPHGWNSKCFRLTYCSYEMALHRSLVIKYQQEVIGPVLEQHLNVTVR